MKIIKIAINIIGFFLGVFLLVLNVYGLSIDHYAAYKDDNNLNSVELIYDIMDSDFKKLGRSEKFLESVAKNSDKLMKYDWPTNYEYMPAYENWILFSMRIFDPIVSKYILSDSNILIFRNVELQDYKKAFKRGFGICSQQSLAFSDLLWDRYGLDARVAGLNGHVVVQVINLENNDYILDPSFHTYTLGNVKKPELISESYLERLKVV